MQENFLEYAIEKHRYLFFCATAGFFAFSTNISHPIMDSLYLFHEGEYVGLLWNIRSFYNGETPFPLLIHGAMDYIPAIVASFIYGDDHVIVGTRAINTIAVWICWLLFLDLCYLLTHKKGGHALWVAIAITIFIAFAPALHTQALMVQEAFIGTRDLFIIITVWSFAKYLEPTATRERLFLIVGTISAVIAIFWSYDRGIMALVFLGIMFLGAMINRKALDAMLLLIVACMSIVILQYSNIFGSMIENIDNIIYWVKYSTEIWGASTSELSTFLITSAVLLFCMATIAVAFKNRHDVIENNKYVFVLGILAIQIILLKSALNAPYMTRMLGSIWPSILMMLYFASRKFSINSKISFEFSISPPPGEATRYILSSC